MKQKVTDDELSILSSELSCKITELLREFLNKTGTFPRLTIERTDMMNFRDPHASEIVDIWGEVSIDELEYRKGMTIEELRQMHIGTFNTEDKDNDK